MFIKLKDLTDFKWDRVYIFTPYTRHEKIDEALGFVWQPARSIGIDLHDNFNLIVFTHNGQVASYLTHPRSLGDLANIKKPEGFGPDEAIFVVDEIKQNSADGRPLKTLLSLRERTQ
jgi:hypothetical protein